MDFDIRKALTKQEQMASISLYNPLLGRSISQLQAIFDHARSGCYALIQRIYYEIEQTDPVLMVCADRRTGYLPSLGYTVAAKSGADQTLADEQCAALDEMINSIDNFPEAVEHLGLAFFRGYSHVSPVHNGTSMHLEILNSWNFNQDPCTKVWFWNPRATWDAPGGPGQILVPPGEMITVSRPRLIDYPAMSIYLRHALGDKDWGRFLERYGIPPCVVIMPELTNKNDAPKYEAAARKVANALSGTLPAGSQVMFSSDARSADPFSGFIRHQEELLVLLATGGTLTSLAQSGTGTLAGDAQMQVWKQITERDAAIIGSVLNRSLCRELIKREFPGRPIVAEFSLGRERKRSAEEVFDMAAKGRAAGVLIDISELEEMTGLHLERDTLGVSGGLSGGFVANASPMPLQNVAKPLQVAPPMSEVPSEGSISESDSTGLLGSIADDLSGVAKEVQELLTGESIDADAARKLSEKIAAVKPSGEKFATLMAGQMAKAVEDLDREANKKGKKDE